MKKCYTGRVALLTLLISVAGFSFSSLANDDEEILNLFNETARSLPSAAAEKAQSREAMPSAELKAWQKEKRQLQKRIAQLEALRAQEARAQPSRTSDETDRLIKKLEEEIRTNKQTIAGQEKALKAAEAKNSGQQTDAKITSLHQQLQASERQLAQLRQEKQSLSAQLNQQQAERQQALQNVQTKLEASERQLAQLRQQKQAASAQKPPQSGEQKQLQAQLAALQQQYQQSQQESEKQRQRADTLDKELTQLTHLMNTSKALAQDVGNAVKPGSSAPSLPLQTEAERDSYTLGQFLATNVNTQIKIIKDAGINILSEPLNAGLTTKLNNGQSAIGDKEMEARYRKLDEKVNQGMNRLIAEGYEKLRKKIGNRKVLKQNEGMSWFTVKPVKNRLRANAVAAVTVKITTLGGKTINTFSDEQLTFDQNLPPLLYEGLSLTGKGGEIEGWALAQDIFERESLPGWVAPYEVLRYQIAVK